MVTKTKNNMAARRTSKKSEETLILPPITSNLAQPRRNVAKTLGNFGAYVLLPSLDPMQNMNAIYDVKRFCKVVREWYTTWRIWQKEVLLCSLSEKCSVNLLTSLSTILEPVFHRDFVSRLHGKYPHIKPKPTMLNGSKISDNKYETKVKVQPSECKVIELGRKKTDTLSRRKFTATLGTSNDDSIGIVKESVSKDDPKSMAQEIEVLVEQVETTVISEKVEEIQNQSTTCDHVSYLTDLIKESLLKSDNEIQHIIPKTEASSNISKPDAACKSTEQIRFISTSDIYECRSNHVHTANIFNKDTGTRFFSASRCKRLSDMKADLSRNGKSEQGKRVRLLDQKCYKHRRWWSADPKEKQLASAQGLNLWKYYTGQLKEVNKRMDSWGDHERVNVISEVIKSSDPEQINFFAQCLIQRLKDNTDVSILPDQTLLKIFFKLDARTLCQISQVSRRWRYLAEDGELWKNKCLDLGLSNGVNNLIVLIEKSADHSTVDWKQAYQEVYKLFQQSKRDETLKEQQQEELENRAHIIVPVESTSTTSECEQSQDMSSEDDHISDHKITSTATIAAEIQVELLDMTPATVETEVDRSSLSAGEDVDNENDDLTGGNLGMLEETLSELTGRKQEENNDEIAYDIRPNKVQPFNEMEDIEKENHQLVTVGVEDVKSVKRVRKLQGHMDGVYTVQFDAKRCLTGSADRLLRMWDVRSGRAIRTMTGHLGGVRCAQFDNEKILSGSWDTTIMIWDVVKFTCIGILHGHQGCVSCLRFNSKHLVSGSHDMTVRVWDVDTWECLHVLEGHTGEVTCLFLGGAFLLTGSTDKTVKLWNIETGECMKTLVGHKSPVLSVQACRALVISGSEEGKIMFWDLERGSPVAIIQAHDGPCNCLYVWGNHFLSGGGDNLVKQWDICTMTCLRTLQGHKGPVQCVKMSWSKIISSSEDGTVRIWDLEAPIHKLGCQFDEFENLLLPFTTLEHDDDEV